ncbi:hypothetical protein D3C75_596540 [compost metagenome]
MQLAALQYVRFFGIRIGGYQLMIDFQLLRQLAHHGLAGKKGVRSLLNDKTLAMQRFYLAAEALVLLHENDIRLNSGFPVIFADIKSGAEAAKASADNDYFSCCAGHDWLTLNCPAAVRTTSLSTDI